jgi:hypothetical protein
VGNIFAHNPTITITPPVCYQAGGAPGSNDTGTPRADTISLVPEGVALLEAERIARANEQVMGCCSAWLQMYYMHQVGSKS